MRKEISQLFPPLTMEKACLFIEPKAILFFKYKNNKIITKKETKVRYSIAFSFKKNYFITKV